MGNTTSKFLINVNSFTIKAAQRGDLEAHEEIYRLFSRPVYNLALRICGQVSCAEDALQSTFVNILQKIQTYRFQAPVGLWIRKIAVNQTLMLLRKQNHQKHVFHLNRNDMSNIIDFYSYQTEGANSPVFEQAQAQRDISIMLAALPAKTRAVLWLKEVEGYTHREIGELMEMSASYSKSLVSRTYELLRSRYLNNTDNPSVEKQ